MSPSNWCLSPGYIIHTHVQYSDSEATKSRFPVVVSAKSFNRRYPEVIVAFTTSSKNVHHPRTYDVEISDKHRDFRKTGLTHSTTIRCGRLWTVDRRKIADVIGVVPDDVLTDVKKLVLESFKG
jgi:mRNA-degrading endonuclease toxin of MazEF toxin-antitoxin module